MRVSDVGTMQGLIAAFTITQEFRHSEPCPVDISYIIPTDNKLCLYETVFYVGRDVIKAELEHKKLGDRKFFEAKANGKTVLVGTSLGEGVIEFRIANVPNTVPVRAEVKACVWCNTTGPDLLLVKLPLDVCTPDGSLQSLTANFSGSFSFVFSYGTWQSSIADVKMNLKGSVDPRKAEISAQRTPDKSEIVVMSVPEILPAP